MRVFLDLMWFFRERKGHYLGGILLLMLVSLLGLIPPQIVGAMVNRIRHHQLTAQEFTHWIFYIAAIALAMYILRYFWRILLFGSAIKLSTELRFQLYRHFTQMSPNFYHKHRIGDLMAHATNDIQAVESTAMDGILTLVDSITTGILVIATMAITISWKLTLIALLPMPIIAITTQLYGKILHRRFTLAQAAFSDINDKVQENISGMRVIKAFGQENSEKQAFADLSKDVIRKNLAVAKIDALFDPTIGIVVTLSYFLSFAAGAWFVLHHQLNLGQLTAFSIYLGQLIWPMLAFGWLFNIVERGHASYDRIRKLLAIKSDIADKPDAINSVPSGSIHYTVHSFTYPESSMPSLQQIYFHLHRGKTLGIVGRTGSGKSTILRLLLREFDVKNGDIQIGEQSIYHYTLDALRQAVAYVPQDHFLFSATIAENIAFAAPDKSFAEIQEAAQMAQIHDDIQQFPNGYNTIVGERGVTLSGGQKQRISIARALLMDAEILILDDALSAVDARTEHRILESLRKNRSGKTTLIATHRLSAVEHADLILVLEDGKIAEYGTHASLCSENGIYRAMWDRQQLESLVEEGGIA